MPGESEHESTSFLGLTTSRDGHLGFITAINERVYRRLNILQGQIINNEEQPAALNPRSYRYLAVSFLLTKDSQLMKRRRQIQQEASWTGRF